MTRPLVLQWFPGGVFWSLYLLQMIAEAHLTARWRSPRGGGGKDRGSLALLLVAFWGGMALATWLAIVAPGATLWRGRVVWFWTGVALYTAGGLLRQVCIRVLGERFTPAVTVSAGQSIVERGPYRFVRHPSYSGGALLFVGYGLALTNAWSVAVMAAAAAAAYCYRIRVEERALVETIGEPYRDYMRRSKRLVPWLW